MSWIDELTDGPKYHPTNPQWTDERRAIEEKRRVEDDARRTKEADDRLANMVRAKGL